MLARRLGWITGLLAALASAPALADMRAAADAFARGDYQTAAREWLPHAAQGNPEALFQLGQLYRRGLGVEQDVERAERYYRRAAQRGHVLAQGNLGTLLYFKTPEPDRAGAIKWWSSAARNGDPRSQYMLGALYANGDDMPRDFVEAYAWLSLAAANGLADAAKARASLAKTLDRKTRAAGLMRAREIAPEIDLSALPEPTAEAVAKAPAASPRAPAAAPPASPTTPQGAETSPPPPVTEGRYMVQLGALESEPAAVDEWAQLTRTHGDLLGAYEPQIEPITRKDMGRTFFRLRVGPFASHDDASDLCRLLTARKAPCFVARRSRP